MDKNIAELFRVLNTADLESDGIPEEVTVLLGMSRVGKTTLIRWITNPTSLIGNEDRQCIYVDASNSQNQPKIGHDDVSVTILPNKVTFKRKGRQTTIIDFGGFGERKGAHDVIKVNYAMASYLLKIKKGRFIIVLSKSNFEISNTAYRDTMNQFLNLFDFASMTEEERRQLYCSVSICVTSFSKSQQDLIEKFKTKNISLKKLYIQNEQNMIKYPFYEELIKNVLDEKRFGGFPKAVTNMPPPTCHLLDDLESKDWRYYSVNARKRSFFSSPFVANFHKLKPEENQKCCNSIKNKYQPLNDLFYLFKGVLETLVSNIATKDIDFDYVFIELQQFVDKHNFYKNIPKQGAKYPSPPLSSVQRLRLLRKLIEVNSKMKDFNSWRQQKEEDEWLLLQKYYNEHLLTNFNEELDIFDAILGSTPRKRSCLRDIRFIVKRSLEEILIFQVLNKKQEMEERTDLAYELRVKIKDFISYGSLFTRNQFQLDRCFVEDLTHQITTKKCGSPQEAEEIVQELRRLEQKYLRLDSMVVYEIIYRLYFFISEQKYSFSALLEGLLFTIHHQLCLNVRPQESHSIKHLLTHQKKILGKVMEGLVLKKLYDLALQGCTDLKQYTIKFQTFQLILQQEPQNLSYQRQFGEYCQSIGRSQQAYDSNVEYMRRTKSMQLSRVNERIEDEFKMNNRKRKLLEVEEQTNLMSPEIILRIVQTLKRKVLLQENPPSLDMKEVVSHYQARVGKIQIEQAEVSQYIKNPTMREYIASSEELISSIKMRGKSITILLSASQGSGMTTAANYILKLPLQCKLINGKMCYDRPANSKINRINHDGSRPTSIPYFISGREEENDVIDMGCFLDQDQPQKVVVSAHILEQLTRSCSSYRFVLVVREQNIIQGHCEQIVTLLSFLMNIFSIQSQKDPVLDLIGKSLSLMITFSKNKPESIKKISEAKQKLFKSHFKQFNFEVCSRLMKQLERRNDKIDVPQQKDKGTVQFQNLPDDPDSLLLDSWDYLPANVSDVSFPGAIAASMPTHQIKALKKSIQNKRTVIGNIIKDLFFIIYQKYQCLKRQQVDQGTPVLQKIKKNFDLSIPEGHLSDEKIQFSSACLKNLKTFLQLSKIKKVSHLIDINQFWPDNYAQQLAKITEVVDLLFNCQFFCCCTPTELAIMESWKNYSLEMFYQLQILSDLLLTTPNQEIKCELSNISCLKDDIAHQIQFIQKLPYYFFKICGLDKISKLQSLYEQEECLKMYKCILQTLQQQKEQSSLIENLLIEVNEFEISLYKKMKQIKPHMMAMSTYIRTHIDTNNPEKSFSQGKLKTYLSLIARGLAPDNPTLALRIGEFLKCDHSQEAAYQQLHRRSTTDNDRKKYLMLLIYFGYKLRKARQELEELHDDLMRLIPSNLKNNNMATIERVVEYQQQRLSKISPIRGDAVVKFIEEIDRQITI